MSQLDGLAIWSALRGDLAGIVTIPDRSHQGILNHLLAMKLMRGAFASDPAVIFNGSSVIDTARPYYWGISQGGILVRQGVRTHVAHTS